MRLTRFAMNTLAALALTTASTGVVLTTVASPGQAAPAAAQACPDPNWENLENLVATDNFNDINIPILTGDNGSCTVLGQGQPTDDTLLHCATLNAQGVWFDHLVDERTALAGWVRESHLYIIAGPIC